ncbi:hypothetical protein BW716_32820 [[Flexibacter] sp. ATCC 35208]|nr:hypothetical protein BW716_32820 [[Flexibacter] sp. ATCC 35208]
MYLKELEATFNVNGNEITILSLEETDSIIEQSVDKTNNDIISKQIIPFDDKEDILRFYIDNCSRLQPNKVYVVTDYSKECGVAVLDSLIRLNPNFAFNAEHTGIISILSEDLSNKLILDFYEENDRFFLEIETAGNLWGKIRKDN